MFFRHTIGTKKKLWILGCDIGILRFQAQTDKIRHRIRCAAAAHNPLSVDSCHGRTGPDHNGRTPVNITVGGVALLSADRSRAAAVRGSPSPPLVSIVLACKHRWGLCVRVVCRLSGGGGGREACDEASKAQRNYFL